MPVAVLLDWPQVEEFCNILRPDGGLIVFAAINPDGKGAITARTFDWPKEQRKVREFLEGHAEWNLYYCPNPPKSKLRRKPNKGDMAGGWFLWTDNDPPIDKDTNWRTARRILRTEVLPKLRGIEPTVIVDSGNGYQCLVRCEPAEDVNEYETVNNGFGRAFGSFGTYTVEHLMRLPGTLNHPTPKKLAKGYPQAPRPSGIVAQATKDQTVTLADMADRYPVEISVRVGAGSAGVPVELTEEQQQQVLARWAKTVAEYPAAAGWWAGGTDGLNDETRSNRDFVIVRAARGAGFTFDETWWLVTERFEHGTVARDGVTKETLRQMQRSWERCGVRSAQEVFDEVVEDTPPTTWPKPKAVAPEEREPKPFPLGVLPEIVRDAVLEVNNFVQAPIAMAVSEAISFMSLVVQAHIDVVRADGLEGPVSIFSFDLGESGERKSQLEKEFGRPLKEWQEENENKAAEDMGFYKADLMQWEFSMEKARDDLHKAVKNDDQTEMKDAKERLATLEASEPKEPFKPNYIVLDETFENLTWSLVHRWPTVGLISSEGGLFTNSASMSKDNRVRMLALLNTLWSGDSYPVGRKTDKAFYNVERVRVTLSIMIQPEALGAFFKETGGIGRGIGFFARALPCWPTSTIGTRFFRERDDLMGCKLRFDRRIRKILNMELPLNDNGKLDPKKLVLSTRAKKIWRDFFNRIEGQLGPLGEYSDVKDIGSKIADVAARLAAIFTFFEDDKAVKVPGDMMRRGVVLAEWYLQESQRFFSSLRRTEQTKLAVKIDETLVARCRATGKDFVPYRDLRTYGPLRSRDEEETLRNILLDLVEWNRVRLRRRGTKQILIYVNPAILA